MDISSSSSSSGASSSLHPSGSYTPPAHILQKYADVLVKFALWNGEGAKPGDVVRVDVPECAKPLMLPLQKAVLEAGAHPMIQLIPDETAKHFYEQATMEQVTFVPENYIRGKIDTMTHKIHIIAEYDKHALKHIDPKKLTARRSAMKFAKDLMFDKEGDGKFTRTLALYGTDAMAQEVGMTTQEYREQIIQACFLDYEDPIAERKKTFAMLENIKQYLDSLPIVSVHMSGEDCDLTIQIGEDRQRLAGTGRNVPSFELFTSPNWRGTNGWIKFNQPLYVMGQMIKGIELEFIDGIVTKATAQENESFLHELLTIPNANKIGEFSLTDSRCSRITKFMAETLYDENIGGKYGNTHIAIGSAYKDAYKGNTLGFTKNDRDRLGFNDSAEHKDIVSTTNRKVTATLSDGTKHVIYRDGEFTIDF